MTHPVNDNALDTLFRNARSYNGFEPRDVPETIVRAVYDLTKWGPTSANCCPARFLYIHSEQGKERLLPHMAAGNRDKVRQAPWVVIIAHDIEFQEKLPELFPHNPGARNWFNDPENRLATAFRNGTLQSAYFLFAARALGLDTGPMSGFSNEGVDEEFFLSCDDEMKTWRSNWICNLGYGTSENLFDRSPRLSFEQAGRII